MNRLLAILFLLPAIAFGAAGDITSLTIRPDGWSATLVIEGMGTNGTWSFGFATNNTPTDATKIKLTVYSPSFDDTGASNWTSRTVYGTKQVRLPYPSQAFADQQLSATHVTNRIALSDYVYVNDGDITATILSGVYTSNHVSAAWSGSVANGSTQPYPKVIGNWTWPPFQLVQNPMRLRAVAFHGSAQQGRPVRLVKFSAIDQHSHGVTNIVTRMSVDRSLPDAMPFGEYIYDLDISTFTQGDLITCNFVAYPWIGTADSILDTAATGFSFPTVHPAPLTNVCNVAGTYGVVRAIVDAGTGNDSTGVAASEAYWATNQSPPAFATIGRAGVAIAGTNNALYASGRAGGGVELGGGIIMLNAGVHKMLGLSASLTTGNQTWLTIQPSAGVPRTDVIITNDTTDRVFVTDKDRVRFSNVILHAGSSYVFWDQNVWADNCYLRGDGSVFAASLTGENEVYITHCVITNIVAGIRAPAGEFLAYPLVRGNTLTNFGGIVQIYTVIGNKFLNPGVDGANQWFWLSSVAQSWPKPLYGIFYNNALYGLHADLAQLEGPTKTNTAIGAVIVQNLIENKRGPNGARSQSIGSTSGFDHTNLIVWHNSWIGARTFYGYNNSGTAASYRYQWSTVGNIWDDYNTKSDTQDSPNGNRIGNWPIMFGVGYRGNIDLATTSVGAPTAFENVDASTPNFGFSGIGCVEAYGVFGATQSTNWPAFTARLAFDGVNNSCAGGGDYRPKSSSPLSGIPGAGVLPFDIEGNPRGANDPPGVFATGNPRKGFF